MRSLEHFQVDFFDIDLVVGIEAKSLSHRDHLSTAYRWSGFLAAIETLKRYQKPPVKT
jgi:hypothetical protein